MYTRYETRKGETEEMRKEEGQDGRCDIEEETEWGMDRVQKGGVSGGEIKGGKILTKPLFEYTEMKN